MITKVIVTLLLLKVFSFQSISFTYPPELVQLLSQFKPIEFTYSRFGHVQENFKSNGRIVSDDSFKDGCSPFSSTIPSSIDAPPVFLIDRGNCTFVTKARNVQRAGGSAVLLVNNEEGNVNNIYMLDDGTASDIAIPVLLIRKREGEIIKNYIQRNKANKEIIDRIYIEIKLYYEHSDIVNVDLFFSSEDQNAYKFIINFYDFQKEFDNTIKFTPYYVSHREEADFDNKNCISKGKYCASITNSEFKGRNIMIENVYQKCIYQQSDIAYYNYINEFYYQCYVNQKINERCRDKVINEELTYLNRTSVEQCVKESFQSTELNEATYDNNDNSILRRDYMKATEYELRYHPALFVNKNKVKGRFSIHHAIGMICTYLSNSPDICDDYLHSGKNIKRNRLFWVLCIVITVVIINILLYVLCRKYIAKKIGERLSTNSIDIEGRINNTMNNYFRLKDASPRPVLVKK